MMVIFDCTINYCVNRTNPCTHTCIYDGPGKYHCECPEIVSYLGADGFSCLCNLGYVLDIDNKSCTEINYCNTNSTCEGTCIYDGPGKYHCTCPESVSSLAFDGILCVCNAGYEKDILHICTAINYCQNGRNICEGLCVYDGPGKYHCICPDTNTHLAPDGFSCHCNYGYKYDTSSKTCTEINYCVGSQNPCKGGCVYDAPGYYHCTCPEKISFLAGDGFSCACSAGYNLDPSTGFCKAINYCLNESISLCEGKCIYDGPGQYHCMCPNGTSVLGPDGHSCICSPGHSMDPLSHDCVASSCIFDDWQSWSPCPACKNFMRVRARNLSELNMALPELCSSQLVESKPCAYPCIDKTVTSMDAALSHLYNSFVDDTWLQTLFPSITNIMKRSTEITCQFPLTRKRATTNSSCLNDLVALNLSDFLLNTSVRALPSIDPNRLSSLIETNQSECFVSLVVAPLPVPLDSTPIIVGVVVGVTLLLLLIVLGYMIWSRRIDNAYLLLPEAVGSHIKYYHSNKDSWESLGTNIHRKLISPSSPEGRKILELFETGLFGQNISVKEIYAVMNPVLLQNFLATVKVMQARSSDTLFNQRTWEGGPDEPKKRIVYNRYQVRINNFSWNNNSQVMILPTVHGTDAPVAWQICSTGFAALSSLDAGYYGKGIYFSTYADYSVPYLTTKEKPVMIISFVLPGNIYPVTEKHCSPNALIGAAMKNGHQSHYVLTNYDGLISPVVVEQQTNVAEKDIFDEIVISQEAQILPSFVLYVDVKASRQKRRENRRKRQETTETSGTKPERKKNSKLKWSLSSLQKTW
eukprot:TRINITY_DN5652_c0_g1_i3.p1 TRINITY_DN5652_c0_g1~~TRINITY_DN5652_c0_g1_i3.p1  ORF type:complete len:808 (+),score=144.64 TRINITY_DN5652_c0_g1_i3:2222-4645(+)